MLNLFPLNIPGFIALPVPIGVSVKLSSFTACLKLPLYVRYCVESE